MCCRRVQLRASTTTTRAARRPPEKKWLMRRPTKPRQPGPARSVASTKAASAMPPLAAPLAQRKAR